MSDSEWLEGGNENDPVKSVLKPCYSPEGGKDSSKAKQATFLLQGQDGVSKPNCSLQRSSYPTKDKMVLEKTSLEFLNSSWQSETDLAPRYTKTQSSTGLVGHSKETVKEQVSNYLLNRFDCQEDPPPSENGKVQEQCTQHLLTDSQDICIIQSPAVDMVHCSGYLMALPKVITGLRTEQLRPF
ncbi:hypothetical protein BTVI_150607 [Pitangus sulphuratus]|nr:hypothetical protein BTVI_150607 [Pitangus sulphuratus]